MEARVVVFVLTACSAVVEGAPAPTVPPLVCRQRANIVMLASVPASEETAKFRLTLGRGSTRTEELVDPMWRADINGDGIGDLQLRFYGTCGNHGECIYGVYVGCGGRRYAVVFAPDYHYELGRAKTKTVVAGATWTDLVLVEREEIESPQTLRFDGSRFR